MRQRRTAKALVVVTLVRGLLALGLALIILLGGEAAGRMLGNFIGLYIFAGGAITLRWWLPYDRTSVLPGVAGVLGIVTGVAALGRFLLGRALSVDTAAQVLGMLVLLTGWTRIVGGFDTPGTAHRFRMLEGCLLGGFELLLGVLLVLYPTMIGAPERPPQLTALLVGWGLVGGATLIAQAWRGRAKLRAAEQTGVAEKGA